MNQSLSHSLATLSCSIACVISMVVLPVPARASNISELLDSVVDRVSDEDSHDQVRYWVLKMSRQLKTRIKNPYYRLQLLATVYEQAQRYELKPEWVLSVIEIESTFKRKVISKSGAIGLMQIMPFWIKEIGHPRDDLYHPETNIRYGCKILSYYLDLADGDLEAALAYYNGSYGSRTYPNKFMLALNSKFATTRDNLLLARR